MDTVYAVHRSAPTPDSPKKQSQAILGEQPAERREGPEPQASTLGEFFEG